jgi:ABC-type dipeptide/oligopeptide/nickel transport system permease subunit
MTDITRLVHMTMTWQKRPEMLRWPRWQLLKGLHWPRQRLIAIGLTITVCWAFLALCSPWLMPYDPLQGDASLVAGPPSLAHPFGLDKYGRDVLARVVSGGRYDLFIAVVAVGLAVIAGTAIGSVSGFIGGTFDNFLWGVMISEGSPYIVSGQWWMSCFPGAALMLLTAGFILIGDGLNAHAER